MMCKGNQEHPPHKKNNYCLECHDERIKAKWEAMPSKELDGSPVTIYDTDQYFFDAESLHDFLCDEGLAVDDIRLVFCIPNKAREINPNEHFCDKLDEDGEVSAELAAAFDALNAVINRQPPMSWSPGNVRVILPADFLGEA